MAGLRKAFDVLYYACVLVGCTAMVLISAVIPWAVFTAEILLSVADVLDLRCRRPLAGDGGGFGFHGHAQFEHLDHTIQRPQSVRIDHIRLPAGVGADERPGPLPGDHQSPCPQCSNRLPNDGAADAHRRHHFLLGGKFGAGRKLARGDFLSQPVADLVAEATHRLHRPQQRIGFLPRSGT